MAIVVECSVPNPQTHPDFFVHVTNQKTTYLSVTEFTEQVKDLLEETFPMLYVQGEVSNFTHQRSGHIYFSLKDAKAQVSCAMFRNSAKGHQTLFQEGDEIVVKAQMSVYPPRGSYQLIVKDFRSVGLGDLLLQFQELKKELEALGYFEKKKPLPKVPKRIGVITSPTGAVIQDILRTLDTRVGTYDLLLNPVKVQGAGAKEEIAQAIDQMNAHKLCDCLIIARGGGSFEDLFPFSERIVADSIFRSALPIISAVGHETDTSIADLVADHRAPTPTAAAVLAFAEKQALLESLAQKTQHIDQTLRYKLKTSSLLLERVSKHPLFQDPNHLLANAFQKLDELEQTTTVVIRHRLEKARMRLDTLKKNLHALNPQTQLHTHRQHLERIEQLLTRGIHTYFADRKIRLKHLTSILHAINPNALLKKGYSLLYTQKDQKLVTKTQDLEGQTQLIAILSDGSVTLEIPSKESLS